jgi:hypothetical protein
MDYQVLADVLKTLLTAVEIAAKQESEKWAIAKQEEVNPVVTPTKKVEKEKKEVTVTVSLDGRYTLEELKIMSFNELKQVASKLGVKAIGKREDIQSRILSVPPLPESVPKDDIKVSTKVEEESNEDESEDDPLYIEINQFRDSELRDVLATIKFSTKGKHEALVDRVIQAINEGLIENPLESADDTIEEENGNNGVDVESIKKSNEGITGESNEEEPEDSDSDEEDLIGMFPILQANYENNMTEARLAEMDSLESELSSDDYDESEMNELLSGFYGENYSAEEFTLEEKKALYIESRKLYIDDDGMEHDDNVLYTVNGSLYSKW